ncbi:hypothetical protein CHL78_003155 [Romboutsia weinsteinii]|uniref:Flagellar protein n=1 Tax=Romboutsia weinsteinii TaxID=2020949 RepID=A0A371J899_9FIRM|nr:hypothetical protein [Romboutsia weinsteinii]RDY28933.1 hypothetical protein CHL78_003155 [Romboutsia weinsteinii]
MGDNLIEYLINLSVFIPIVLILIVVSIKLSKVNIETNKKNNYISILEKTNLNKDTSILVLKTGDEGFVIISSPSHTEKIKKLSKDEILLIENSKISMRTDLNKINIKKLASKFDTRKNRDGEFE